MSKLRTYSLRGKKAIVRLIAMGLESPGEIAPAKTFTKASARVIADRQAPISAQLYSKRLYLPQWRRETIEQLEKQPGKPSGPQPQ